MRWKKGDRVKSKDLISIQKIGGKLKKYPRGSRLQIIKGKVAPEDELVWYQVRFPDGVKSIMGEFELEERKKNRSKLRKNVKKYSKTAGKLALTRAAAGAGLLATAVLMRMGDEAGADFYARIKKRMKKRRR